MRKLIAAAVLLVIIAMAIFFSSPNTKASIEATNLPTEDNVPKSVEKPTNSMVTVSGTIGVEIEGI